MLNFSFAFPELYRTVGLARLDAEFRRHLDNADANLIGAQWIALCLKKMRGVTRSTQIEIEKT